MNTDIDARVDAFAAQARRIVLRACRFQPRSMGELAELAHVRESTMSRHVRSLKHLGLVKVVQDGNRVQVTTNSEAVGQALDAIKDDILRVPEQGVYDDPEVWLVIPGGDL